MASSELAKIENDDSGLSARQVDALERLLELNAAPAPVDENGRIKWDSNPQIRALQMIYEGRLGGPREGSGRKSSKRAAEELAERIRTKKIDKMDRALDRALSKKAGARTNLDAIKLAVDIERGERKLQIEEEEHEGNVGNTREEIIAALIELAQNPEVESALEASYEEITDATVIDSGSSSVGENGFNGTSAGATENGHNGRSVSRNGHKGIEREGKEDKNPLRKAAARRAANKRSVT